MTDHRPGTSRRLTARGAVTRARIVRAAADLMYVRGVTGTSIDQVVETSGTSKSQVYHYFADKDALVAAVITDQAEQVLDQQEPLLERLDSFEGLERWRDLLVQRVRACKGANGCPLGTLASELADRSEPARILLHASFQSWEAHLAAGLSRMRDKGELTSEAEPLALATGIMAAVQGGYLLARTARSEHPMEVALDMALNQVRAHCRAAPGEPTTSTSSDRGRVGTASPSAQQ